MAKMGYVEGPGLGMDDQGGRSHQSAPMALIDRARSKGSRSEYAWAEQSNPMA